MTVRTMYVLSRRPGMSFDEFRTHWRDVHMPLAAQVPGIVKYVRRVVVPDGDGEAPDNEYGIDGFAALDSECVEAMEAGWATVQVTTLGEEFARGITGECVVEDFPSPGETVALEWQESQQNFVLTRMD